MGKHKQKLSARVMSVLLGASMVITGINFSPQDVSAKENEQEPWLLSEGRPAYASTVSGGDKALFITDGRMTTAWGAAATEGETLEENEKKLDQWVDIDLGASADLSSLEINWQGAWVYAASYDILVSDDEEKWTKVYENPAGDGGQAYHVYEVGEKKKAVEYAVKKDDDGNWIAADPEKQADLDSFAEAGQNRAYEIYRETVDLSGKGAEGRYVRLQTHGSWSQSENMDLRKGYGVAVRELKVYGTGGVNPPTVSAVNIAPGHPTDASTEVVDWDILRKSEGAFDGDDSTYWKSKESNDEWVQVDLEKIYRIGRMTIEWVAEFGRIYDIQTSLDGENWTTVYRQLHGIGEKEEIYMYQDARYVRMKGYAMGRGSGYTVKEIQIFEWQEGDPKENPIVEALPEKQVVEVGEGSYVIDEMNLRQPREPYYVTENISTPIVSNDWWTSVMYQRLSDAIVTLPYAMQYTETGLGLYYADEQYITNSSEWGASGVIGSGSEQNDLTVNTSAIKHTPSSKVDKYDDWSVDVVWSDDDTPKMKTTMVKGSPFIYNTFSDPQEVEISAYKFIRFFDKDHHDILTEDGQSVVTDHIGVVTGNQTKGAPDLNDRTDKNQEHSFGIYVPEGTRFTRIGSKLKIQLGNNENYLTIGTIDNGADLEYLYPYAYTYVTKTAVDYQYDEASAMVTTNYHCEVEQKRTGDGIKNETLMCLFPHQWRNSDAKVQEDKYYSSIRGKLKIHEGNDFNYKLKFTGVIPAFSAPDENTDGYDKELMKEYLEMFKDSTEGNYWIADPYWQGKKTHPIAMGIMIAEQLGDYETRDMLIGSLRKILTNWLSYDGEDDFPYYMYYSKNWGSLNGNGGDFGMAMNLTDHHFVWAYFIYPAAVLASYDPTFVEEYGDMLEMLIRDCMNPDKDDEMFPFMRNFDPYEGHSWAGGYCDNPDGNNQESAGEATFAWAGLYLWGLVTGNDKYRDAGIWGWTCESNAVLEYWFDVHDENWMDKYKEGCVGMVFGLTYNNGTYFGVNPSSIYGIHLLPVTPAQSYMGYNQEYATDIYAKYREAQDRYQKYLADKGTPDYDPEGWYHIMLPFLSLSDPKKAVSIWDEQWSQMNEDGTQHTSNLAKERDELFSSYWYLQNMNAKGQFTDDIWAANYTSYQVFKNEAGTYTATVWNPTAEPITVSFRNKDGKTADVTVAANSLTDVDPTKDGSYGTSAPSADLYEDVYGVQGYIRAKDYSSNFSCSIQENEYVGAIKNKSALTYNIDVTEAGEYTIEYRIKSIRDTTGGTLRAKTDLSDDTLSKTTFVNDDKWEKETWTTLSDKITLQEGEQQLKLIFNAEEDYDEIWLDWIRIYKDGTTPPDGGDDAGTADLSGLPAIDLSTAKASASSEQDANGKAQNAVDGDTSTRWESEAKDPQTLTVELAKETEIGGFSLLWEAAAAKVYTVDVSLDGGTWKTIYQKEDGKGNDKISVKLDSVYPAKYVRVNGTERVGGYGYSIFEFALYGKGDDQRILLDAPELKTKKEGESAVKLSWNAVENAKEYKIYRALSQKAVKKEIATTKDTVYTDENLTEGTYYYWVAATPGTSDVYGDSKYSKDTNGVHISTPAIVLEKTTVRAEKEGEDAIRISWDTVANAKYYEVYRTTGTLAKVRIAKVSDLSYVDGSLPAGKYSYRVIAIPAENSGYAKSDYSDVTPQIQISKKLAAPEVTAVKSGDNSIALKWNAVENAESYRVYRASGKDGEKAYAASVQNHGYTDMGLSNGTWYYWVIAIPAGSDYLQSDYSADIAGVTLSDSSVEVVEAESITLNRTEAEMLTGEKIKLTASIEPSNVTDTSVIWTSSDEETAAVEGGVVAAVSAGEAVITAKTVNGKEASCKITVKEAEKPTPGDTEKPTPGDTEKPTPDNTEKPAPDNTEKPTPDNTEKPLPGDTEKPSPGDTEKPTPGDTEKPTPGDTEKPTPDNTEKPTPGDTEKPTPGDTEKPTPGDTEKPTPDNTENPGSTEIPGNTESPGGTEIPGSTERPGSSEKPGSTETPGSTAGQNPNPGDTQIPGKVTVSKITVAAESRPYGIRTIYLKQNTKLKLKTDVTVVSDTTGTKSVNTGVTYQTSNRKIAAVNAKGQVKAGKKNGTAVITVTSVSDPSKHVKIKVKVVSKTAENRALKLKKTKMLLKAKDEKAQIQFKNYTKTTTSPVTYKVISGKNCVKVDKYGVVTCKVKPGKKAQKAQIQVSCGNKKQTVTVTIPKK